MVSFDLESDGRFDSIRELGPRAQLEVEESLAKITAQKLTWEQFTSIHGWIPLPLYGADTYPGAIELHRFFVKARSNTYELIGYTHNNCVVICAMARVA